MLSAALLLIIELPPLDCALFFFFNDTATTEIYTLSLHDALPISYPLITLAWARVRHQFARHLLAQGIDPAALKSESRGERSEEHTSELQSLTNLVCRLLLEKKKHIPQHGDPVLFTNRVLELLLCA